MAPAQPYPRPTRAVVAARLMLRGTSNDVLAERLRAYNAGNKDHLSQVQRLALLDEIADRMAGVTMPPPAATDRMVETANLFHDHENDLPDEQWFEPLHGQVVVWPGLGYPRHARGRMDIRWVHTDERPALRVHASGGPGLVITVTPVASNVIDIREESR